MVLCARGAEALAAAATGLGGPERVRTVVATCRPPKAPNTSWPTRSRGSGGSTSSSTTSPRPAAQISTRHPMTCGRRPSTRRSFRPSGCRGSPCRTCAAGGGVILMIASIYGRESGGRMTYNVVKAAEISLAKAMALQLARTHPRQQRGARIHLVRRRNMVETPAGGSGGDAGIRRARDPHGPLRSC